MSTKRQPSKQRRQTQNRANRAALEKRRQNVEAGVVPAGKVGGASSSTTTAPAAKPSLFSRLTGSGGTTSGSTIGSNARPGQKQLPTGYRAALTALFLAVVGLVFAVTLKAPVDHTGEVFRNRDDKTADWAWAAVDEAVRQPDASAEALAKDIDWNPGGSEPYITAELPYSLAVVLPLFAAGLAFWTVRKGGNSKMVNRCMYASLFGALLTQQLAIMFLPAAIAIGVAGFQLRKEELANGPDPGAADDGVIDVDAVEVDDEDDVAVADVADVDDVEDVIDATAAAEPVAADDVDEDDEPDDVVRPPKRRAAGGLQLTNRDDD